MGKLVVFLVAVLLLPVSWTFYAVVIALRRSRGPFGFFVAMIAYVVSVAVLALGVSEGYLGPFQCLLVLLVMHAGAVWHFRIKVASEFRSLKKGFGLK